MNDKRIIELLEGIGGQLDAIEYVMNGYERTAEASVLSIEDRVHCVEVEIMNLRTVLEGLVHAIPYIKTELAAISFNTGIERHEVAVRQPEDRADAKSQPE